MTVIFKTLFYLAILYFLWGGLVVFLSFITPAHIKNKKYWGFVFSGILVTIMGVLAYRYDNYIFILVGIASTFLIRKIFGGEPDLNPNKLTKGNSKNLNDFIDSAVYLAEAGNYEEALNAFDKALQIDHQNIFALTSKANTLNRLGKYEEAIAICDKALKIAPKDIWSLLYKATALTNLDKYMEAMKYFDNVIEIDPKNLEAKKNKGRCHYRCYEKLGILDEMPEYTWEEILHISTENLIKEVNVILAKKNKDKI